GHPVRLLGRDRRHLRAHRRVVLVEQRGGGLHREPAVDRRLALVEERRREPGKGRRVAARPYREEARRAAEVELALAEELGIVDKLVKPVGHLDPIKRFPWARRRAAAERLHNGLGLFRRRNRFGVTGLWA